MRVEMPAGNGCSNCAVVTPCAPVTDCSLASIES